MVIIGIDLGTTNSLVSVWKDGDSIVIPNSVGSNLTPSVVSLAEDDNVLVGQAAKERLITFPQNTASCFKRTMGQNYFYKLNQKTFSSTELSALVLKNLKQDAEKYLGEEVTEAVISVPAYFNQNQRKATKDAALMAGLKVDRLVSEPTAAALCYGIQNKSDMSTVLVLDLGGGTFDVSLLELFDGIIDVKAVSGDNQLGGEDYTKAIAAWFMSVNDLVDKLGPEELSKVIKLSETAKRTVTSVENAVALMEGNFLGKEIRTTLTYQTFQAITEDLQQKILVPIKKVLKDAGITRDDVDAVILMGGSTRMVNIKNFAQEIFGEKIITSYNPDETVAKGAAVLAAMKQHDVELKETVLTDICPFSLGVEVRNHSEIQNIGAMNERNTIFDPIIERNSSVPISIFKLYQSGYPGQEKVEINVYQGESLAVEENVFLGKLEMPLPPSGSLEAIRVRFTYDINGLLEVEGTTLSDEKTSTLLLNNKNQMTELELKQAQENMERLKIVPWEQQENILIVEKGKRLYAESLGDRREEIIKALEEFNHVMASQNPILIKKTAEKISKFFDSLESDW